MASNIIPIGADASIAYSGAQDLDGNYLNAATVTYALKTVTGTTVTSGTLAYLGGSNGNYRATMQSTVTSTMTPGAEYRLEITFAQGDFDDFRRLPVWAQYRGIA